jgi:HemY protein
VLVRHGDQKQALKMIETVWATKPHPDPAAAYLEALSGESNTTKLARWRGRPRRPQRAGEPAYRRGGRTVGARLRQGPRRARAADRRRTSSDGAHLRLLMAEIEDGVQGPSGPVREWLAADRARRAILSGSPMASF